MDVADLFEDLRQQPVPRLAVGASVFCGIGCLCRYCSRRRWRRRQVRNDGAREAILVYQPGGWRESTTTW